MRVNTKCDSPALASLLNLQDKCIKSEYVAVAVLLYAASTVARGVPSHWMDSPVQLGSETAYAKSCRQDTEPTSTIQARSSSAHPHQAVQQTAPLNDSLHEIAVDAVAMSRSLVISVP